MAKTKFKGTIVCPKCQAELQVTVKEEVIQKAVPAEKEQTVEVKILEAK